MTDNHMVFFAEIAFIYGGNDSSEKDVFGSETTAISSGTQSQSSRGKAKCRNSHTIGIKQDFFSSYIKSQKQACDSCLFSHIELLFR